MQGRVDMKIFFVLMLLPGCSLIFSAEDIDGEEGAIEVGADSGALELVDGGTSPIDGDAAGTADALDAALCDPYIDVGCYVQNNPLGGPSIEQAGTGAIHSSCTESSDCESFMFCTGTFGTDGLCLMLCDVGDYECPIINEFDIRGRCFTAGWQSFGFCEKAWGI